VSLQFYNKLKNKPSVDLNNSVDNLKAANNVPLDVVGTVDLDVVICGVSIPVMFYVVRNLSQNCIVGGPFLEECGANINYANKTLSLYENTTTVPLLNDVELNKTLCTITKLRIPPLSEVIFPSKLYTPTNEIITGITEALPAARNRGLFVANVLQNTSKPTLVCRMLNTTRKTVYLPANFAFGFLSCIDVTEGVNLIDVDAVHDNSDGVNDVSTESNSLDMPDHDARLAYLQACGIQIGTDVLNDDESQKLTALLYSYRDVFASDYKDVPAADVPPHRIVLKDTKVVNERRFRYNPTQERLLEKRCDELLAAGMLRESTSVWNSPVFLINQKGDRSARFLVDFRAVNAKAEPLYCSLPSLEEVFDQIGDEKPKIYTVMDLKAGYYSVPLEETSRQYTAFSTKNRHLEFTRLPQGYRNAPTVFTQALSNIFAQELRSTLLIYIDDLICFHRDVKTHLKHLEQILAKFRKFKLRLHPSKLRFAMSSVKFLGYEIGQNGYTTDTSRTSVIKNYPRPKSQRDIKRFTGLCAYFRRTIRNYSKRAEPLRRLLIKDAPFVWTDEQEQAFCDLKNALCNPPVLGFPDRNKPMRLTLDGCATGLGYILSNVNDDGTETVLHYGARATTKTERNYSATDLELAALLTGIRTFNSYLANTHFEVLSDHISLTYIRNLKFGTSRLVRASIMLSQYDFSIRHLSGKSNRATDAISRIPNLEADDLTLQEQQRCSNDVNNDITGPFENGGEHVTTQPLNHNAGDTENDTKRNVIESVNSVDNILSFNCNKECVLSKPKCETRHVSCDTDDIVYDDVKNAARSIIIGNDAEHDVAGNTLIVTNVTPVECINDNVVCDSQTENEIMHKHMQMNNNVFNAENVQKERNVSKGQSYDNLQTQKRTHFVTAVSQKKKRRNKRSKTLHFHDPVTDKNVNRTSQTTDINETTKTSLNNDNIIPTGQLADDSSGETTNGSSNTVADPLNDCSTHEPTNEINTNNDSASVSIATQLSDPDFYHIINYLLYGTLPTDDKIARKTLLLSDYYVISDGRLFHLMTSRRKTNKMQEGLMKQLCIPKEMRTKTLDKFHSQLMHAGSEKMYLTMRTKIYWPNMYNEVREFVANCETCYKVKANTHVKKAKIQIREIPKTVFHTIHIDHLKMAVPNAMHQYNYVLIIIDELSLQIELIPTKTTSASECANALIDNWFCRYGVPTVLISDRHKAFTGALTQCLLKLCGIKHLLISPRNPRSNGICEQVNSRIINGIKIHCANNGNWPKLLPVIAAAYRAAVTPNRQYSPFHILYGFDMRLPIDSELSTTLSDHNRQDANTDVFRDRMKILRSEVQEFAQDKRERVTTTLNKTKTATEYKIGQKVYLVNETIKPEEYRKSAVRFTGPYVIIGKSDHNTYKLSHIYTGKILKSFVHFDKLKPSTEARRKRRMTNTDSRDGARTTSRGRPTTSPVDDGPTTDGIVTGDDNDDKDDKESTDNTKDSQHYRQATSDIKTKQLTNITADTSNNSNNETNRDQTTEHMEVSKTQNNVTTAFAFDNAIFDLHDDCTYTNSMSVECRDLPPPKSCIHRRSSEMKNILKITRSNGYLRCHVLLKNGTRLVCRPVQIPSHLLCSYRLRKYKQQRKN